MNLKILVATHKKYWMPKEDIYLPIQVGSAFNHENLGYTKDNTKINIAEKNKNYCELTATYWGWKNLEADYIGLCHYRRYFSRIASKSKDIKYLKSLLLTKDEYLNILGQYDIILPKPIRFNKSVFDFYKKYHHIEDLVLAGEIIHELFPSYDDAYKEHMNSRNTHMYNMLATSKDIFNAYCDWLFPILFELESRIDISCYNDYQKRIFGFLAERLMDVFVKKNNQLKVYESNVVFLEPKLSFWNKQMTLFYKSLEKQARYNMLYLC